MKRLHNILRANYKTLQLQQYILSYKLKNTKFLQHILRQKMSDECKSKCGLPLENVVFELNKFADLRLAETWDNVGLLIEPVTPTNIYNILLTNDLTESVLEEAVRLKTNLIISYHPPIFAPLKRITNSSWKERIVATCFENRIAVFSPHTSWDAAAGGVTDWLIQAFNGEFDYHKRVAIQPSILEDETSVCVDLFGPSMVLEHVLSSCEGIVILSSTCRDGRVHHKLLTSNKEVHKFMELEATDVVVNKVKKKPDDVTGMGRIIEVNSIPITKCIELLKKHLGLKHIRVALAKGKTTDFQVKKIAFVPGSGGSLLKGVVADLFVTGEMFHHDMLEANHNGISVILTNHSDSERGFLHCMKQNLKSIFTDENVNVMISLQDRDPVVTV